MNSGFRSYSIKQPLNNSLHRSVIPWHESISKTNIKDWWQKWVHWDIKAETLRSLGIYEIMSRESSDKNHVKGKRGL